MRHVRTGAAVSSLTLLTAFAAFGQVHRTFHLDNPPPASFFPEIATILHTVAGIKTVNVDGPSASVSVSGTSGDIALAAWLIQALDTTVTQSRSLAVFEYRVPGGRDDVLRIFYLANIDAPQGIQELLTMLRTVGDLQPVSQYTSLHAVVVRGTLDQITLAAWLVNELDQPPSVNTEGSHQFQSSDAKFPVVRAFYLTHRTPKDLQDTLTALRGALHIQRAFAHTARAVVIISGSPGQVEDAARLVTARDRGVP